MYADVEDRLIRELREVAGGIEVPAMPELPQQPGRPAWQPLLVAAALVLIALAAVATLTNLGDDQRVQPAPPAPTRATDGAEEPTALGTGPPRIPYVLDGRLVVAGTEVPGAWGSVDGTDDGWVAVQLDGRYRYGSGPQAQSMQGSGDQPPVVSPSGEYVGRIVRQSGAGQLTGFQTAPGGEGFGGVEVPLRDDDQVGVRVGAMTDDGWLVASGRGVGVLWRPLVVDAATVDLTQTAPDQLFWQATPAGLVVVDGSDGARGPDGGDVYLAELSEAGELTRTADLPNFADLDASSSWIAYVPPGVIEGEVTSFDELSVQRVDGSDAGTLTPPDGLSFVNGGFAFEDDDALVASVTGPRGEAMVRCSPAEQRCVLLDLR